MSSKKKSGQDPHGSGGDELTRQNADSKPVPIPPQLLQQADAAASAATTDGHVSREQSVLDTEPPIEDVPPPPYSADQYGKIDINEKGMDTGARVAQDGRVDIKISSKNKRLTQLLKHQLDATNQETVTPPEPEIPEGLGYIAGLPPPPMNVVIQIVGSRGDVQPFVALGLILKNNFNHRVRIATHPVFKDFVTENGLEFFSIGGDPAELMAFMVKNPGLMPGFEAIRSGDIGKRRKGIYEMVTGCWRSCIEPGDGTGAPASDESLDGSSVDSGISVSDPSAKPFVADAIIANPPSFAHIHIAEKLGIPLHLMFTMPWSPTQSFPHPLANIVSSNADAAMTNFLSYILVDLLTWQGIGDVINRFREKSLNLEPLSIIWAPGNLHRLKIPWTYCWSPALIPKPGDWPSTIDISGFYFLNLATNYRSPADLTEFLDAGPPPVYIGFGSIVVDDPNAMTKLIFEAVKKSGQRALVSKGWGGLSGDEMGVPEGVFMLGNCPHDWLFKKVSCVVHHGGAGTTAAGISAGRPTIIVPFFGDQQFWGQMCHRAGAGPEPIPHKKLTADNLAEAINIALKPETLDRAKEMSEKIKQEEGTHSGADSFHRHLKMTAMRCSICPERVAVWQYKKSKIRLSALAATVLANEGLLDFHDLRLYRSREYSPETGPPEPISGGAAALIGSISAVGAGVADYPSEVWKAFKKSHKPREHDVGSPGSSSARTSASTLDTPAGHGTLSPNSVMSPTASVSDLSSTTPRSSNIIVTDTETGTNVRSPTPSRQSTSDSATMSPGNSSLSLRPETSTRHSRRSRDGSPMGSGATTPRSHERSQSLNNAGQITMDSLIGGAKATGNIVAAGMKSPLDFTMSLAQGFHNAPKLYGDKTVRQTEKITGFHSGIRAATKEFGYGFYDGIAGLVTQPYQGAKEEGVAGFGKGLLKGSFGLVLKPGAAIWGLPGYTMKGIYAEIVKNFGKSTANFIIASRTAQGYEDWKSSSDDERERIVGLWKSEIAKAKVKGKRVGGKEINGKSVGGDHAAEHAGNDSRFYDENGQLLKGFFATKHLSYDDRKELNRLRKEAKSHDKSKSREAEGTSAFSPARLGSATDEEVEHAIRTAVESTSTNDADEDARIERAIRASIREFQRKMSTDTSHRAADDHDDEAYNRAVAASIVEYKRPQVQQHRQESSTVEMTLSSIDDDEEFTRALAASLAESRTAHTRSAVHDDYDTDDEDLVRALEHSKHHGRQYDSEDEDYKRAVRESISSHSAARPNQSRGLTSTPPPPDYEQSSRPGNSALNTDKKVNPSNKQMETQRSSRDPQDADDDEELSKALKASEQESKQQELELEKQRTEEDIVMEYVKKQSLLEEEHRRKAASK